MRKERSRWNGYRRGISGPEVVILVAILGFLIALLLPAVQAAREAARRSQCANHMRQWVLGLHVYHDAFLTFPAGVGVAGESVQVALLPFMEMQPLYEQLVANKCTSVDQIGELVAPIAGTDAKAPMFGCPADRMMVNGVTGSYRFCSGDSIVVASDAQVVDEGEPKTDAQRTRASARRSRRFQFQSSENDPQGNWVPRAMFGLTPDEKPYWTSLADITDGTSNTMAISEGRIVNDPTATAIGVFTDWNATETTAIPADCAANSDIRATEYSWLGARWYDGRMTCTRYLGILPPNAPSCVQNSETNLPLISASSYHKGGVNVGMCGGSVRFIQPTGAASDEHPADYTVNAIGILAGERSPYGVWGAMASMNGNESVFVY